MEGLEIVITPRIIERVVYGAVIVILLMLAIFNMGGEKCIAPESQGITAMVAAEPNTTANSTPVQAASLKSDNACSNGVKDGDETDVDCGGSCEACGEFLGCNRDSDCGDGMYCYQHLKCIAPTCEDGIKNQDEENVDCGGVCEGVWWTSDDSCHDSEEPSGRLEAQVSVEFSESELSQNVVLEEIVLEIQNGLDKDVALDAEIYAMDRRGEHIFQDREGEPQPLIETSIETVESGDSITFPIDLSESTRKTLSGVKADDEFTIEVKLLDGDGDEVETLTWTNIQEG